jgi:hypothetical protein
MDLKPILARLVRLQPKEPKTLPLLIRGERVILKLLQAKGLPGAEKLVADLNAIGHRFQMVVRAPGTRTWREELEGGERAFNIYVASLPGYRASSLRYEAVPKPPKLTPAERKREALQNRFYDRYMAVGQKAYNDPRARISPMDRTLLLVGELEADVNNGGFSQYLDNKGTRRARTALAALRAIGARKTAAMLEAALKPGVSDAELSRLDDRFYKAPEDLAVLGARHAKL